jgi:hypothetical protein
MFFSCVRHREPARDIRQRHRPAKHLER